MNFEIAIKHCLLGFLTFALLQLSPVIADIKDARITEVWVGLGGGRPDGTHDWIEVTNTGVSTIDTSELAYDDSGPSLATANVLPSILLATGESAIFIVDLPPDNTTTFFTNSIEEFTTVWVPSDAKFVGAMDDAGRLSTNGESANLLNSTTGALIDTFTYSGNDADTFMTIERTGESSTDVRKSVLGENGAFESQTYLDEDTGVTAIDVKTGDPIVLVGSPGIYTPERLGDVNCDGVVNLLDVQPFVNAISSGLFNSKADMNQDGAVNLLDVNLFVTALSGS